MNEYIAISAPSQRSKFGFKKSPARLTAEMNELLNSMASEDWVYTGSQMETGMLVFEREVPVLSETNQTDVARTLVSEPLAKPIVLRRPRPSSRSEAPATTFKSRNAEQANTENSENVLALRG